MRRAVTTYDVPRTTLRRQRARTTAQCNCKANLKKLTKLKESVIIEHILDLDSRGFAPSLSAVRDIANKLFAERAAS